MATSGSFVRRLNGNWGLRLRWSADQNRANNTSTITITLSIFADSGYNISPAWGNRAVRLSIDGNDANYTRTASNFTVGNGGESTIATRTRTVSHNANGTKSLDIGYRTDLFLQLPWGTTELQWASNTWNITLDRIDVAPKIWVRHANVWRPAEGVWVRHANTWRRSYNLWVRHANVWRKAD